MGVQQQRNAGSFLVGAASIPQSGHYTLALCTLGPQARRAQKTWPAERRKRRGFVHTPTRFAGADWAVTMPNPGFPANVVVSSYPAFRVAPVWQGNLKPRDVRNVITRNVETGQHPVSVLKR